MLLFDFVVSSAWKFFYVLHCEKISPLAPDILEQSLWILIFSCICVHDVCRYHQTNTYLFAVEKRYIPSTKVQIPCSLNYVLCRKLKYDSYAICEIEYMMLLVSYMDHGVLPISLTNSYYLLSETAYIFLMFTTWILEFHPWVWTLLQEFVVSSRLLRSGYL